MIKNKLIERLSKNNLLKDSFWALFGNSVSKILALIIGITIANMLGSEDYGKYGLIKSTLISISVFSTFGLGITGTKYIAQYKDSNADIINNICHDIVKISLYTSGLIAIIIILFARQIAMYLEMSDMTSTLRLSSIAIVFNAINTAQTGILAGFKKFKDISNYNLITGIYLCVCSIAATYYIGLNGAILSLGSSYIINFFLNNFTLSKIRKNYPKITKKKSFIKDMIFFSLPLALQEGLQSLSNWLTIVVLVKLSCYSEYGIYSAAAQWTAAISFIPAILKNVTLSYLSDTTTNNSKIVKIMLLANLVSSGVFFIIILIASSLISRWYGESFDGISIVLNILIFSSVLGSLGSVFVQELISKSKNWITFSISLLKTILIILVGCILIIGMKYRGAMAFSYSTLFANIVYLSLLVVSYKKYLKS
ncbi:MAG TPA: oligosaccharide flippase family protein [Candidatus Coprenecus pullistercoris]|nr:oligosaccharide flippase family protein [Candidatus Coprenecus pullistercoris]